MPNAATAPDAHIESLMQKHHELDAKIHEEELHPLPVGDYLKQLKRRKLLIKDQIHHALALLKRNKAKMAS